MITQYAFEAAMDDSIELGNSYYNATLMEKLEPKILD